MSFDVGPGPRSSQPAPLEPLWTRRTPRRAGGEIWFDISRTLWRVLYGSLTGIDRVQIAYAGQLLAQAPDRLRFVAYDYRGDFAALSHGRAASLIRAIGPAWHDGSLRRLRRPALDLLAQSLLARTRLRAADHAAVRPTYLNVSNHPLQCGAAVGRMLRRTGAAFVPMVHDLIPMEHPQYCPARWPARHAQCIDTIVRFADGIIANSATTASALRPHLPPSHSLATVPLGIASAPAGVALTAEAPPARPYFLCLGTVEARKNHITLLNVWRRLAAMQQGPIPRLVIVGKRGWRNEQVLTALDRCTVLRPHVEERGVISDAEVAALMAGAAALVMPSFCEGFGLPVAEALSRGLPVICSDIPAHREIGGDVPDYLAPLDEVGWEQAILDFARPFSRRRAAQTARLAYWRWASWEDHVAEALDYVDAIAACAAARAPAPAPAIAPGRPAPYGGIAAV